MVFDFWCLNRLGSKVKGLVDFCLFFWVDSSPGKISTVSLHQRPLWASWVESSSWVQGGEKTIHYDLYLFSWQSPTRILLIGLIGPITILHSLHSKLVERCAGLSWKLLLTVLSDKPNSPTRCTRALFCTWTNKSARNQQKEFLKFRTIWKRDGI